MKNVNNTILIQFGLWKNYTYRKLKKKDLIAIEYLNNIIGTTEEDAWSAKRKIS